MAENPKTPINPLPEAPKPAETQIPWVDPPQVKVACSANMCKNGHTWIPVVGIATCPGCRAPILAIQMVNCPVCNEPVASVRLRSDHLPKGGNLTPLCMGATTLAEVQEITLERTHSEEYESKHPEYEDRLVSKVDRDATPTSEK